MKPRRKFLRENKDRPFFLYYPTTVPHLALQVPEDSLAEYKDAFPGGTLHGRQWLSAASHPSRRVCRDGDASGSGDWEAARARATISGCAKTRSSFSRATTVRSSIGMAAPTRIFSTARRIAGSQRQLLRGGLPRAVHRPLDR